jgi:hypothetical protein
VNLQNRPFLPAAAQLPHSLSESGFGKVLQIYFHKLSIYYRQFIGISKINDFAAGTNELCKKVLTNGFTFDYINLHLLNE